MNSKRSIIPDVYKQRKKICYSRSHNISDNKDAEKSDLSSDTKTALRLLHSLFPTEKFERRLPPIIMKHQLYSIIKNKTEADRQLNELTNCGEIRLFHLGAEADDLCIVFTEDYKKHVKRLNENNPFIDRFLETLISECPDISLNKDVLAERFNIKEEEISELFKASVLTVRDVGSWWISIPGAGEFMKCFLRGRKAVMLMIRKSKYGEVLQQELQSRKLPKAAKLGVLYHIHDIIGADLVHCVNTTSGTLLRLRE